MTQNTALKQLESLIGDLQAMEIDIFSLYRSAKMHKSPKGQALESVKQHCYKKVYEQLNEIVWCSKIELEKLKEATSS